MEEFDRQDKVQSKSSRSHESGGKSEKSSRSKHKHKDEKSRSKRKESDCFSPRSRGTTSGKEKFDPDTSGSR